MKRTNRLTLYAALLPIAWAGACGGDGTTQVEQPTLPADVEALRASLAPYLSPTLAKNAGYDVALTDCMSNGDEGAMGFHFAKGSLVDGTVDPLHPEALIYEPGTDGQMSLVGVEFVVPFAAISRESPAPVLFGQSYERNDVFQVWALHVWTHRANPSGLFAPWNPRVHC